MRTRLAIWICSFVDFSQSGFLVVVCFAFQCRRFFVFLQGGGFQVCCSFSLILRASFFCSRSFHLEVRCSFVDIDCKLVLTLLFPVVQGDLLASGILPPC